MDRLRALRYLEVAAAKGSFSAAARRFDVSVAAVAKLIGSLERELGVNVMTALQAIVWHALRRVGVTDRIEGFGRLFREF